MCGILKYGLRLCKSEKNPVKAIKREKTQFDAYPPMTCFTDIPLTQITDHAKNYGKFGIGVKKDWAMKIGAQPVIYLNDTSLFYRSLYLFDQQLIQTCSKELYQEFQNNQLLKSLQRQLFKAFQGLHGLTQEYEDYSEREWRVIEDYTNEYQNSCRNPDPTSLFNVIKIEAENIVLVVVPESYILRVKNCIKSEYGEDTKFPIIPFEYIEKL